MKDLCLPVYKISEITINVTTIVVLLKLIVLQGLSDPEETVVCKTLEAITVFCEQGLFNDQRLLEMFTESIPFLCHPVSVA